MNIGKPEEIGLIKKVQIFKMVVTKNIVQKIKQDLRAVAPKPPQPPKVQAPKPPKLKLPK